jgi:hypothetical protein
MSLVCLCKDAGYAYQEYEARVLDSTSKVQKVASGSGKINLFPISSNSVKLHSATTMVSDIHVDRGPSNP